MTDHTPAQQQPQGRRRDPVVMWNIGNGLREITVMYRWASERVYVTWGDSRRYEQLNPNQWLHHTYDRTGAYKVQLWTFSSFAFITEFQVIIRDELRPDVPVTLDPLERTVAVAAAPAELDDTGLLPLYRVHWTLYTDPEVYTDFWGLPGATARRQLPPGNHRARVIDLGTKRWIEHPITVPEPDLEFTVTATGRDATLTVDHATAGKELVVAWGDVSLTEPVPGKTAHHTYPSTVDDTYLVQLAYADGSGTAAHPLSIPGGTP